MKKILLIILLATIGLHAESWTYISPGIRLGYNKYDGIEFSFQITNGILADNIGRNIPGVTLGATWNKNYHAYYTDLQLGRPGFFDFSANLEGPLFWGGGIGGMIVIYDKNKVSDYIEYYNRTKLWAGCFGLVSYEYRWSLKHDNIHNWGVVGMFPLPTSPNWAP